MRCGEPEEAHVLGMTTFVIRAPRDQMARFIDGLCPAFVPPAPLWLRIRNRLLSPLR